MASATGSGMSSPMNAENPDTKSCRFCGESILAVAIKCKHCGEFLEDAKREPVAVTVDGPTQAIGLTRTNQSVPFTGAEKNLIKLLILGAGLFILLAALINAVVDVPPRRVAQASAPQARILPACSPETYESRVSAYAKKLPSEDKARLLEALIKLDTAFTISAKANGLTMSDSDVNRYMAGVVCGRSLSAIDLLARAALPTP